MPSKLCHKEKRWKRQRHELEVIRWTRSNSTHTNRELIVSCRLHCNPSRNIRSRRLCVPMLWVRQGGRIVPKRLKPKNTFSWRVLKTFASTKNGHRNDRKKQRRKQIVIYCKLPVATRYWLPAKYAAHDAPIEEGKKREGTTQRKLRIY